MRVPRLSRWPGGKSYFNSARQEDLKLSHSSRQAGTSKFRSFVADDAKTDETSCDCGDHLARRFGSSKGSVDTGTRSVSNLSFGSLFQRPIADVLTQSHDDNPHCWHHLLPQGL